MRKGDLGCLLSHVFPEIYCCNKKLDSISGPKYSLGFNMCLSQLKRDCSNFKRRRKESRGGGNKGGLSHRNQFESWKTPLKLQSRPNQLQSLSTSPRTSSPLKKLAKERNSREKESAKERKRVSSPQQLRVLALDSVIRLLILIDCRFS